ncbi:MAG: NapC/NirT family cytochrome c [Melioribacteraceae bacterium]|nr:NapC/NirT family cytochrome c [Melioribacteraceae bacterium]
MKEKYFKFLLGVSVNWIGKLGMILTTSAFITFIVVEIPRLLGILTNAYIGLITYLLLPFLFIIGLILLPLGWWKYHKETGKSLDELATERFEDDELRAKTYGSRIFRVVIILTIANVIFLSAASFRTMSFMDDAEFCGTACHSVMNPEWMTYQDSPHANVNCVDCHVGEGVGALISSKLNGAYQMISVTFNLYERPIPTPVHQLRPARETCEKCHWPDKFYGSRLKRIVRYDSDETSTAKYTTLNLKIDTGSKVGKAGIHWHIGKNNEVKYASVDDKRQEMLWVETKQDDGTYKKYINKTLGESDNSFEETRIMDCVDCHNRATHIYEDPRKAVDIRIATGEIDHSLPFIKREALSSISKTFAEKELAKEVIRTHMERFYRNNYSSLADTKGKEIETAVKTLQRVYDKNVHPNMNIEWGSYPNHLGHDRDAGCFRCHNNDMVDESGTAIRYDCTLCHNILASDSETPFQYLRPVEKADPDSAMHVYLQEEFLNSYK